MHRGPAVLLLLLLPGCLHSNFNLATRREEYTITSTEKEVSLGRTIAHRVTKELPVTADEPMQQKVRAIGERIVAVCDRKELVYTFTVIHDDEVNAFSLPGGYVYLNDGLIKKADSDDELAGVIAHEVAHITARHAVKRYESNLGMQLAQVAAIASRSRSAGGMGVAMQAAQLAYARQDELEADRLAVKYMKLAGFDPTAMLKFLQKLSALHSTRITYLPRGMTRPQYAMTPPYVPERIRAVKEALYGVADYIDYLNSPQ